MKILLEEKELLVVRSLVNECESIVNMFGGKSTEHTISVDGVPYIEAVVSKIKKALVFAKVDVDSNNSMTITIRSHLFEKFAKTLKRYLFVIVPAYMTIITSSSGVIEEIDEMISEEKEIINLSEIQSSTEKDSNLK